MGDEMECADLGFVHVCRPCASGGVKWVPRARASSIRGGGREVESPDCPDCLLPRCTELGLDETLMKLMTLTCRRVCTAVAILGCCVVCEGFGGAAISRELVWA